MLAEAMRFAIQQVNKLDILHGYKFNLTSMFNCLTEFCVREKIRDTFLTKTQFLIGPYSSETSYYGSILTDTFQLPSISYSATYSDFGRYGLMQRYMYRTVPSDDYRILAALQFIRQSNWTYVGVISSHGYDGERDAILFIRKLSKYGACLSSQRKIPRYEDTEKHYENIIEEMLSETRLSVLVLFTTNKDTRNIFRVLKAKKLESRFTILCMYGCTNYLDVVNGNQDISNGTLSMYIHNTEVEEFKSWFLRLKPENHPFGDLYFNTFWENVFHCHVNESENVKLYDKKCTMNEQLDVGQGYYTSTPVHTVLDAVYGMALATKNFIENTCNEFEYRKLELNKNVSIGTAKRICYIGAQRIHKNSKHVRDELLKLVYKDGTLRISDPGNPNDGSRKSTIQYDISRYSYDKTTGQSNIEPVWTWKVQRDENTTSAEVEKKFLAKSEWFMRRHSAQNVGVCSMPCGIGQYMEHDQNYVRNKCCWTCRKCPTDHIVVNNTCIECKNTEFPDEQHTRCLSLPIKAITWGSNVISIIFVLFSVVGLFLTICVALIFSKNNDNRIVRASGRDLCYTIMFGICMIFVCPFLFLTETNKASCIIRGALPGFAFLTCYAPLFLKTNRIYRIFFSARVSVSRPSLVSSQSQFAALFGVLAVQIILSIVWFTSQIPIPESQVSKSGNYVTIHCSSDANPVLMILNLSLSVLFMICCTVLAFKTRRFPKNYNEAKYIGLTLYITCVVWSLFLPIFFLTRSVDYDFLREYLMCIVCILIGFVTLFGMFGPKIIMIYHAPPQGSSQGSLPTWYITNSRDETEHDRENTAFTTITPERS
ncbi:metabotropic glutamate receptor 3-like [Clytia hemisphaerica]